MKNILKAFTLIAAATLLASCTSHKVKTAVFSYADSTRFANSSVNVELPLGSGAAETMRSHLIEIMDYDMSHMANFEGEKDFDPFTGDTSDIQAVIDYYGEQGLKTFSDISQNLAEERAEYAGEDISEELDILKMECNFDIEKTYETDRYIVFTSWNYVYFGGAHGGVIGEGDMTFDKESGERFTNFFKAHAVYELQPAFKEKLIGYFAENGEEVKEDEIMQYLMISDDIIPLPQTTPAPGKDGLTFTYMQYEIASYACGMPTFTIPFDEIKPYLTDEALELLGL